MAIGSKDLGLDPNSGEEDLFRWFLASLLFGKRIQQGVARRGWESLIGHGIDTPQAILGAGWRRLVDVLDEGHYVRYDESTADYLLDVARLLLARYHGKITEVLASSRDATDATKRLEQFRGVGPKTAEIFLRDLDRAALIGRKADGGPVSLTRADLEQESRDALRERARTLHLQAGVTASKEKLIRELAPYYAET